MLGKNILIYSLKKNRTTVRYGSRRHINYNKYNVYCIECTRTFFKKRRIKETLYLSFPIGSTENDL